MFSVRAYDPWISIGADQQDTAFQWFYSENAMRKPMAKAQCILDAIAKTKAREQSGAILRPKGAVGGWIQDVFLGVNDSRPVRVRRFLPSWANQGRKR